jgi:NAD(P)-dependent dehydrogenase (short-subunit alcohol dehydrogenase family)
MAEVVVITGATASMGRAVARRFARQGAKLAMLARKRDELTSAAVEVVTLGATAALAIPCDIEDDAAIAAATQRIEDELGAIDMWIDIPPALARQRSHARLALALGAGFVGLVALGFVLRRVLR